MENEQVVQELSTLKAEVKYLKERDKQLNGTIFRVDQKVDAINKWLLTQSAGLAIAVLLLLYQVSGK